MNMVWTEVEKKFIIENAGRMKDKDMATYLNKIRIADGHTCITVDGLRTYRRRLGIKKEPGHGVIKIKERKHSV